MVAVAVLVPVAPAVVWSESEPSQVTWRLPAEDTASPRSAMPAGGVMELPPPMPKRPTISSPLTVVVTDGAVIDVVAPVVARPPWMSTGAALFTPA